MSRAEAVYQRKLIGRIQTLFPECVILKNDPSENQGIPDLLILNGPCWAMLEVKASHNSPTRPNQPYFVDLLNGMSFAAFIYPENEEQVLNELQSAFRSGW